MTDLPACRPAVLRDGSVASRLHPREWAPSWTADWELPRHGGRNPAGHPFRADGPAVGRILLRDGEGLPSGREHRWAPRPPETWRPCWPWVLPAAVPPGVGPEEEHRRESSPSMIHPWRARLLAESASDHSHPPSWSSSFRRHRHLAMATRSIPHRSRDRTCSGPDSLYRSDDKQSCRPPKIDDEQNLTRSQRARAAGP